jgi:hypothetical protein
VRAGHTVPQTLQFSGSVCVSTQLAPHAVPPMQPSVHAKPPPPTEAQSGVLPPQLTPQLPHAVSEARLCSQPVAIVVSQSAQPLSHVMRQVPLSHATVARLRPVGHAFVQLPQRMRSVARSASQPVAGSASQSPRSGSHATIVHAPPAHEATAPSRSQDWPQRPQLSSSRSRDSQPFAGSPSQSWKPSSQTISQVLATHAATAFGRAAHRVVQSPQRCASEVRSTHAPVHSTSPGLHAATHASPPSVASQNGAPPLHAVLHAPHRAASERLASQPLTRLSSQSP